MTIAKDLTKGEYAGLKRPANLNKEDTWFGTKNAHEYNNSHIEGEVIKINPKNIKIKAVLFPEAWNYGHEYIVPKDAVVEFHMSLNKAKEILKKKDKKLVKV